MQCLSSCESAGCTGAKVQLRAVTEMGVVAAALWW
jgi:hypothetical protein